MNRLVRATKTHPYDKTTSTEVGILLGFFPAGNEIHALIELENGVIHKHYATDIKFIETNPVFDQFKPGYEI